MKIESVSKLPVQVEYEPEMAYTRGDRGKRGAVCASCLHYYEFDAVPKPEVGRCRKVVFTVAQTRTRYDMFTRPGDAACRFFSSGAVLYADDAESDAVHVWCAPCRREVAP